MTRENSDAAADTAESDEQPRKEDKIIENHLERRTEAKEARRSKGGRHERGGGVADSNCEARVWDQIQKTMLKTGAAARRCVNLNVSRRQKMQRTLRVMGVRGRTRGP